MLAPALPYREPGTGDLAKECAWLGVHIPGPAWEAKGSGCQWEPGTGREAEPDRPSPLPLLGTPPVPWPPWSCLDLPEGSCGGRARRKWTLSPFKGAAFKRGVKY